MANPPLHLSSVHEEEAEEELEEEEDLEYRIDKRPDGTEDFHCTIPSCVGIFSYRTLRALNNHRTTTHKLPEIPKRRRGPKKSESSRNRCRSAEAIKRQIMKRAMDISKREQGCRSMAKLRASRNAMSQSSGVMDKDHLAAVIKKVDKALETWEGGSSQRRLLLERRIQMAKFEWTMKGETLSMPTTDVAEVPTKENKANAICLRDDVITDTDNSIINGFPVLFDNTTQGNSKDCCRIMHVQQETGSCQETDLMSNDFEKTSTTSIIDKDENVCGIGTQKIISDDKFNGSKNIWHNFALRKTSSTKQPQVKDLEEEGFCRHKIPFDFGHDCGVL